MLQLKLLIDVDINLSNDQYIVVKVSCSDIDRAGAKNYIQFQHVNQDGKTKDISR